MRLRVPHLLIATLLLAAGLVALLTCGPGAQPDPTPEPEAAQVQRSQGPASDSLALERSERVPLEAESHAEVQSAADEPRSRVTTRQRFVFEDGSPASGASADTHCRVDDGRPIEVRAGPTPTPDRLDERGEIEVERGRVVAIGLGEHAYALVPIEGSGEQAHTLPALVEQVFVVPEGLPQRTSEIELRITSVDLQFLFHAEQTEALLPEPSSSLSRSTHLRCKRLDQLLLAACVRVRLEPYETEVRRTLPRGRYVVEVLRAPLEIWSEPYELAVTGGRSDLKFESIPVSEVEITPDLAIEPVAVRLEGRWTALDSVTGQEKLVGSVSVPLAWRRIESGLICGLRGESKTSKYLQYTVVIVARESGAEVELRSLPRRWEQIPRRFLLDGRRQLFGK